MILDRAPEGRTSLLLAGGGLANGLIAYRLARKRPEISVRLVEGGDRLGGRHTWSFFDTDVGSVGDWISVFVAKSWSAYEVRFPKRRRQVGNFYRSITSQRFHQVLTAELGDRVVLNTRIETLGPDWVDLADGRRLTANLVIDGRGPAGSPDLILGYQKFLGQMVQLAAEHGLDAPIIMDATVDQLDGYRFLYVLPWDTRVLLIEDTRYTDGADLDATACGAASPTTRGAGVGPSRRCWMRRRACFRSRWAAISKRTGAVLGTPPFPDCVRRSSIRPPVTRSRMRWPWRMRSVGWRPSTRLRWSG